jgi:hypothetical protein
VAEELAASRTGPWLQADASHHVQLLLTRGIHERVATARATQLEIGASVNVHEQASSLPLVEATLIAR